MINLHSVPSNHRPCPSSVNGLLDIPFGTLFDSVVKYNRQNIIFIKQDFIILMPHYLNQQHEQPDWLFGQSRGNSQPIRFASLRKTTLNLFCSSCSNSNQGQICESFILRMEALKAFQPPMKQD